MNHRTPARVGSSRVRLAALFWAAAAVASGFPRAAPALIITEVHYHPPGDGIASRRFEFIEIYNEDPDPIDLTGYSFEGVEFTFPYRTFLSGRSYMVVCADEGAIRGAYGIDNAIGNWNPATALANNGERISILNPGGAVVSTLDFNDRGRWPAGADGTGHTLSLRRIFSEVDDPDSWTISLELGGTPGQPNFADQSPGPGGSSEPMDSSGFILHWLVLGPYTGSDCGTLGAAIEADWLLEAPGGTTQTDLIWLDKQVVQTDFARARSTGLHPNAGAALPTIKAFSSPDDTVNLNDAVYPPDPNNVMAYAMAYVDNRTGSPLAANLAVASDDGIAVLINGTPVHQNDICRAVGGSGSIQDRAAVTLEPGKNLVMVKVFERGGGWSFRLRFEQPAITIPIINPSIIRVMTDVTQGMEFGNPVPPPDPPVDPPPPPGATPEFPVVLNEALIRTSGPRWVELYNRGNTSIDLTGYYITDQPEVLKKARLPAGTSIPAREWLVLGESALGLDFSLDGPVPRDRVFVALVDPEGSRVLDGYTFRPLIDGATEARVPDGDEDVEPAADPTPGAANRTSTSSDIVINEINFHPIDEDPEREFIELYNRGAAAVSLTGWELVKGFNFSFPPGTTIEPGQYLVIARNPDRIRSIYGLPPGTVIGPAQDAESLEQFGVLRDSGERITLVDDRGNTADTVRYFDGGEWPRWADGGGSTLELIDPWQENNSPQAWDASDDSAKAATQLFSYTGRHAGGEPEFHLYLLARGIAVVDDIRLSGGETTQLIEDQVFVELGDVWRYFKGVQEASSPATAWRQLGFNDATWLQGPTGIGYGDGDDATVLNDMQGGYLSVFCRKTFTVADPAAVDRLTFQIDYDDGYVAYLNGVEIARAGLAGNPPAFNAAAASHDAGQFDTIDITAQKGLLQAGANVLAVQVHNTNLTSTDLSFRPRLYSAKLIEVPGGANLVPNGDFEADAAGWVIEGTHIWSGQTAENPISGAGSLKVIATGRGDNKVNRIERDIPSGLDTTTNYSISFKARWVVGSQGILTRGYNHGLARSHQLQIPLNLGTPGAPNSVTLRQIARAGEANLGPVIDKVTQDPAVPGDGEKVSIRARIRDADGVASATLRYALETPAAPFAAIPMAGPDSRGYFTAEIPGRPTGSRVLFEIIASDAAGLTGRYPLDHTTRTHPPILDPSNPSPIQRRWVVYRHDTRLPTSRYHVYRFWMHQANEDYLSSRRIHSNDMVEGSFVFGGDAIYHQSHLRFAGSPFLRGGFGGSYRVRMPKDNFLHGRIESFNMESHSTDARERISNYLIRWNAGPIAVPYSIQTMALFQVNTRFSGIREHVYTPNREFLSFWFPNDDDGSFFEVDDRFEFNDGGGRVSNQNARWTYPPYSGDPNDKESYRYYFNLRQDEDEDDYSYLIDTARILTPSVTSDAVFDAEIWSHLNVEQVLRTLAIRMNTDDWDTWGGRRGKNCYLYRPVRDGRWHLFPWDMELTYGSVTAFSMPANYTDTFTNFFTEVQRIINRPRIKRMYYGILKEMVETTFNSNHLKPYMDLLAGAGHSNTNHGQPGGFIDQRADLIRGWINSAVYPQQRLVITTNGGSPMTIAGTRATLAGTAPAEIYTILTLLDGLPHPAAPAVIFSDSNFLGWSLPDLLVPPGAHTIELVGLDSIGDPVDRDSITISSTASWARPAITALEPNQAAPGEEVAIVGTAFRDGLAVFFGALPALVTGFSEAADPTRIRCLVPAGVGGEVPVTVRNIDGQTSDPFLFGTIAPQGRFLRGDANLDRAVDIADAVRILLHLFDGHAVACLDALDADDSGLLEITDAVRVLEYLFLRGAAPPAPFPGLGQDSTADPLDCAAGL